MSSSAEIAIARIDGRRSAKVGERERRGQLVRGLRRSEGSARVREDEDAGPSLMTLWRRAANASLGTGRCRRETIQGL